MLFRSVSQSRYTPGSNDKSIIAIFSDEFIRTKIEKVDALEDNAGLTGIGDVAWMKELENLVDVVKLEIAANPPMKWDALLNNGNLD